MSNEARMQILSLLQEGKITAAEAARLLDAVAAEPEPEPPARTAAAGNGKLHVQVTDTVTDTTRVHFSVPAALARFAAKLLPAGELALELGKVGISGADLKRLQEAIDAGTAGTVLEIEDDAHSYRVDVWID